MFEQQGCLENESSVHTKAPGSEGYRFGQGQPNDFAPTMNDVNGIIPDLPIPTFKDLLTQKPDGLCELVQTTVELNDAEAHTNTLLAFTGNLYEPMDPAETG